MRPCTSYCAAAPPHNWRTYAHALGVRQAPTPFPSGLPQLAVPAFSAPFAPGLAGRLNSATEDLPAGLPRPSTRPDALIGAAAAARIDLVAGLPPTATAASGVASPPLAAGVGLGRPGPGGLLGGAVVHSVCRNAHTACPRQHPGLGLRAPARCASRKNARTRADRPHHQRSTSPLVGRRRSGRPAARGPPRLSAP